MPWCRLLLTFWRPWSSPQRFGVRTHLARSDDGGASFSFVKTVNELPL